MFTVDELNLTEPGNQSLDGKINLLDKIFTECELFINVFLCDCVVIPDKGRTSDVKLAHMYVANLTTFF